MIRWGAHVDYSLKTFDVGSNWGRVVSGVEGEKMVSEWKGSEYIICWKKCRKNKCRGK